MVLLAVLLLGQAVTPTVWNLDYELTRQSLTDNRKGMDAHHYGLQHGSERYTSEWTSKDGKVDSVVFTHLDNQYSLVYNLAGLKPSVTHDEQDYKRAFQVRYTVYSDFGNEKNLAHPAENKSIAGIPCNKYIGTGLGPTEVEIWFPSDPKLRNRIGWLEKIARQKEKGDWVVKADIVTTKVRLGTFPGN